MSASMSSPIPAHQRPDSNNCKKTLRLTENKRRYRARRKAYISDLEAKLAEAREQGVQATKEVQLAARHVILENGRLRDLLRLAGFSNRDIESWLGAESRDHGVDVIESGKAMQSQVEQKAKCCATALASGQRRSHTGCIEGITSASEIAREKVPARALCVLKKAGTAQCIETAEPLASKGSESNATNIPVADVEAETTHIPTASLNGAANEDNAPGIQELAECSRSCHTDKRMIPRCKLLTRLFKNPAADITQVPPVPPSSGDEPQRDAGPSYGGGSIECSQAYDMLIHYATTEEKMDAIASALERGCTEDGKGLCAVKSEVVLQALDSMCG
ncbi:hypothetical protein BR93DRAFT_182027 [Coniochaeta sp. PMI_546]|nr:hypothetical protein BR93DRAFT_182027 [Coniochaeta sp. PMI_546]